MEIGVGRLSGPQRLLQARAVAARIVRLEPRVGPVGVERGRELVQEKWRVTVGEADVPFQTINQRGAGQIGRADVAGVPSGVPAKEPGFGVEAGGACFVADLYLCPTAYELVNCPSLGSTYVGCGDDPEGTSGTAVLLDRIDEQTQALPLNERAKQINLVGRRKLRGEFLVQGWLAARVNQKVCPA